LKDFQPPDKDKISLIIDKTNGLKQKTKLKFKIFSTNPYPVECYYYKNLLSDLPPIIFEGDQKVILNGPNDSKIIEVEIGNKDLKSTQTYVFSMIMNCYNLPDFSVKYESTGIFIPYTYIYSNLDLDLDIPTKKNIINCNDFVNKINPFCMGNNLDSVIHKIKTNITYFFESLLYLSDIFKNLKLSTQPQILNILQDNVFKAKGQYIENKNKKNKYELFFLLSILAQLLSDSECKDIFNDLIFNETNIFNNKDYLNCINKKKNYMNEIILLIEEYIPTNKLVEIINEDMIDNDKISDENLKRLLLLINMISHNVDSFIEEKR